MAPLDTALKIRICDLKNISKSSDQDNKWQTTLGDGSFKKNITLNYVWLQGFLTNVDDNQSLRLWDQTGEATVCCDKVEDDITWVEKGQYCGVIGEIVDTSNEASVLATRLINMSDQQNIQQEIWFYEVDELADLLSGRIANPFSDDI